MAAAYPLALLAVVAVGPPFMFVLWARAREMYAREPLAVVTSRFVYGATMGVALALALGYLFNLGFGTPSAGLGFSALFFATVILAPIVEEVAKAVGLVSARRQLDEPEDGIIHGAAIGLGFAATENFVYGASALFQDSFQMAIAVLGARIVSSTMLHAASTALIGYGYSTALQRGGFAWQVIPLYLVAVLLHGTYNFLVLTQGLWGFFGAVALVGLVLAFLHVEVFRLDRRGAPSIVPAPAAGPASAPGPPPVPSPVWTPVPPAPAPRPVFTLTAMALVPAPSATPAPATARPLALARPSTMARPPRPGRLRAAGPETGSTGTAPRTAARPAPAQPAAPRGPSTRARPPRPRVAVRPATVSIRMQPRAASTRRPAASRSRTRATTATVPGAAGHDRSS